MVELGTEQSSDIAVTTTDPMEVTPVSHMQGTLEMSNSGPRDGDNQPPPPHPHQETDQLEEEKAELESEIAELQKEKERLEFVLVAHAPACKLPYEEPPPLGSGPAEVSTLGKEEPPGPVAFPYQPGTQGPFPSCCFAPGVPPMPPNPSYTSSFVFTYPEGTTCGASHQRSSSSDQSSDSLNSPSLLAL
ncbi:proto-oncogene c-Fos-like [Meleagris gallopavo]|uniref:proto-oncogene c-Fos-like n=1 Tax=Meleagris gallopavo TaxID=9103 RepID=UPI00093B94A1|nr:proto-oncogene c-Fos-like [Meleagris gallopavo]